MLVPTVKALLRFSHIRVARTIRRQKAMADPMSRSLSSAILGPSWPRGRYFSFYYFFSSSSTSSFSEVWRLEFSPPHTKGRYLGRYSFGGPGCVVTGLFHRVRRFLFSFGVFCGFSLQ